MLSLTPFFTTTYAPTSSACNLYDSQFDRDFAHMYSIISDQQKVHHLEPNYSLVENDRQAALEVELPGVAKENISVDITGNKLVISGKRFKSVQTVDEHSGEKAAQGPTEKPEHENTEGNENGKDTEMKDGKDGKQPKPSVVYQLKIRIGRRYDTESIQASMDGNGLLKMVIPMKPKEGPRKIEIA